MEEKILNAVGMSRDGDGQVSDEALLALARAAMKRSYSPYSKYKVGAALLCADGRVFQGCNIENASFGLTNCAERTAMFKAISEGHRSFHRIVIAGKSEDFCVPCGSCRQVMREFAPELEVICLNGKGEAKHYTLRQLLPESFGPEYL